MLKYCTSNLLSKFSPNHDATTPTKTNVPDLKRRQHEYDFWQLWVKKPLCRYDKDILVQLDRSERIEKLEQALNGVEMDYVRLLRTLNQL